MLKSEFEEVIANQPLVIDNGSGVLKAGVAGDELPKCVFPSFVGRPKHRRVMAGAIEGDVFVGKKAEEMRGLLCLRYPMSHGIVDDWIDMEYLWTHAYSEMQITPDEHPVLLTEAPLNPRANRERSAEIFFETFNSPALFLSPQAILALYSSGRTTGVVIDSGDGVSHVVPVVEGFAVNHAVLRSDIAGRDVTHYLTLLLRKNGHIFHTSAELEVVKKIKETACYISFNPHKEDMANFTLSSTLDKSSQSSGGAYPYLLPDGTEIQVGQERYRAPEILFHPILVGLEYAGIHELLVTSISRTDLDLRKSLYSQIFLSGGSTLFLGFGDRLLNEIRKLAPKDIKIRITAPPERQFSTWVGGSILASLATFKKMWISRQQYEDDGPRAIHQLTF